MVSIMFPKVLRLLIYYEKIIFKNFNKKITMNSRSSEKSEMHVHVENKL